MTSGKVCDHTSVGILTWTPDHRLLLIDRARPPFGLAPPAGHVDSHGGYEEAAIAELREEVGLHATGLSLICEGRVDNPCRRVDGTWHYWKVFKADAVGNAMPNKVEAKRIQYMDVEQIQQCSISTLENSSEEQIEKVWIYWFLRLGLIQIPDYFKHELF